MKAIVSFVVSWSLFRIGQFIGFFMDIPWCALCGRLYRIYSPLMIASWDVQRWGGHGPWEDE